MSSRPTGCLEQKDGRSLAAMCGSQKDTRASHSFGTLGLLATLSKKKMSDSLLSTRVSDPDSARGSNGARSWKQCACFGNHGDICCRNLICTQVYTEEHLTSGGWNSYYNLLWLAVSVSMEQVTTLSKAPALPRTLMRLRYIAPH